MRFALPLAIFVLGLTACGQAPVSNVKASEMDFSIRVPREVEGTYGIKIKFAASENHLPSVVYKVASLTQVSGETYEMKEWLCQAESGKQPKQDLSLTAQALRSVPVSTFMVRAWKDAEDQIYIESGAIKSTIGNRLFDVEGDGNPGMTATLTSALGQDEIYFTQSATTLYHIIREGEAEYTGTLEETAVTTILGGSNPSATKTLDQPKSVTRKGTLEMLRFSDGPECEGMFWDNTFLR